MVTNRSTTLRIDCPHCDGQLVVSLSIRAHERVPRPTAPGGVLQIDMVGPEVLSADDDASASTASSAWEHKPKSHPLPTVAEVRELSPMPPPVPPDELAQEVSELRRRIKAARANHP